MEQKGISGGEGNFGFQISHLTVKQLINKPRHFYATTTLINIKKV